MGKKLTIEEVERRIFEKHGDTIRLDRSTYISANYDKAKFIDNEFGEWWTFPYQVMRGSKNPMRARKCREPYISVEEVEGRIEKRHGNSVKLDKSTYTNITTKARFLDENFGEWYARPSDVISGAGHPKRGHYKIRKSRTIAVSSIINRIKKIHGNILELDESTYIDTHTKCVFFDCQYGQFSAIPSNILDGSQHPKRAKQSWMISVKEVERRIYNIHGNAVKLNRDSYQNTYTKCGFFDIKYGEFYAIPYKIFNGSGHPQRAIDRISKSRIIPIETVKEKLHKVHGNIVTVVESTYINVSTKCMFVDKDYGEWLATPYDVINGSGHRNRWKEKSEQTCLNKYGVRNAMHNVEIALRSARGQTNSYIVRHWKTGEKLICIASYEKRAVEYFNKNKIDFKWQHKIFKMPNGQTYRPDCYICECDKWIEIKGYFREKSKKKWDWFHKEYPNSELWDEKKLKSLGIKTRGKI